MAMPQEIRALFRDVYNFLESALPPREGLEYWQLQCDRKDGIILKYHESPLAVELADAAYMELERRLIHERNLAGE